MISKTFDNQGDFKANYAAEQFLRERGFSVGSMQRGDPRGILFGHYDIQKWRNLRKADIQALHGVMRGDMRNGPVTIELFDSAPAEAQAAFHAESVPA
jgi:hypothetical protein